MDKTEVLEVIRNMRTLLDELQEKIENDIQLDTYHVYDLNLAYENLSLSIQS